MQLGDLTSGVNMLPDDSFNKGIQDYYKQETSIAAQKGQLAQNKINEVNNLLNVNLKGLQSQDMDEAVAARDKLIEQAIEAARNSKDLGDIPWNDMKKLIAQKESLEQMAQQSNDAQKLYSTRYQQILSLRDPQQRDKALKNLYAVHNLPTIRERAEYLNSAAIIPDTQYTYGDVAKDYVLPSKDPTPQNKQALQKEVKDGLVNGDYKTMSFYDKWKKENPKGTDDDFVKSFTASLIPYKFTGQTSLSKYAQRQAVANAAKKATKRTVIHADTPNGDVYSFNGVNINGKKNGIVPLGNVPIPNPKNDPSLQGKVYPAATLVRIQKNKKTGVREAVISYTTKDNGEATNLFSSVPQGSYGNTYVAGGGKGSATAVIPLSTLTNTFRTNNIHFDNKQLEQLVYGGGNSQVKSIMNYLKGIKK